MTELDARTAYWQSSMEQAAEFMVGLTELQIDECGEPLVAILPSSDDPDTPLIVAKKNDAGHGPGIAYIRSGLLEPLYGVARKLRSQGLLLRVEHSYRSPGMQVDLILSPVLLDRVVEMVMDETTARPEPELIYRRALGLIACTYRHGTHISGSAVDTSIIDLSTGEEVDRGGKYMALTEITPMDSPFVSPQARENRLRITEVFNEFGFVAYPFEFWHYCQGDVIEQRVNRTCRPARYGPVTRSPDGSVIPVDPDAEIVPMSLILSRIENRIATYFDT